MKIIDRIITGTKNEWLRLETQSYDIAKAIMPSEESQAKPPRLKKDGTPWRKRGKAKR